MGKGAKVRKLSEYVKVRELPGHLEVEQTDGEGQRFGGSLIPREPTHVDRFRQVQRKLLDAVQKVNRTPSQL